MTKTISQNNECEKATTWLVFILLHGTATATLINIYRLQTYIYVVYNIHSQCATVSNATLKKCKA